MVNNVSVNVANVKMEGAIQEQASVTGRVVSLDGQELDVQSCQMVLRYMGEFFLKVNLQQS